VSKKRFSGGLSSGLGGLLFGAAQVSTLLGAPEVAALGGQVFERHAQDMRRESGLSLADGVAGTVLGLSAIAPVLSGSVRASAEGWIDAGVARLEHEAGPAAAGMLSGRAGVALVLGRLGRTSARIALGEQGAGSPAGWADGSAGIAVAGLVHGGPHFQDEVTLRSMLVRDGEATVDGFAFGVAGEADALLWTAAHGAGAHWHEAAAQRISRLATAVSGGGARLVHGAGDDRVRVPGLLHGLAGLGYALLRFADPVAIPSLAAFEPAMPPKAAP
jgi:hypothetical protein